MDTPYMRVSISPEGTNTSHGENKKKRNYTKKNPPTVVKIPCFLRCYYIME